MTTPVRKRKAESDAPRRRASKRPYVTIERDDLTARDVQFMQMNRGVRPPPRYMLPTAAQVRAISNARIGGLQAIENKYLDVNVAAGSMVNNTWALAQLDPGATLCLNAIAQGDGPSNRDGRQYQIRSVHVRGYIIVDPIETQANPLADVLVRLALVLDKQTNGAQVDPTTVFTGTGVNAFNGFRNLEYTQRFRVIEDISFRINSEGGCAAANDFNAPSKVVPFIMNKEFKTPIKVNCNGVGATVASIADNSLHLVGCIAADAVSAPVTRIHYWSRVRFQG